MDWLQLGTLIVLALAALFAGWQVLEARKDRRSRYRPFVVVDFEVIQTIMVEVSISNIGVTPARNVVISFDQDPHTAKDKGRWDALDAAVFHDGIPLMPPGRSTRMLFDRAPDRIDQQLPLTYRATVDYEDDLGKSYSDTYVLDLGWRLHYETIRIKDVHDAVQELEKIRRQVEKLAAKSA